MIPWLVLAIAAFPTLMILGNRNHYRRPARAALRPNLSVLIPARDEAANIGEAVFSVLASKDADFELLVMDDGSTDGTAAILAAIDDPRLRVHQAPAPPPGWAGKQHACARLAELARNELLVFMDADVRLSPDALSRIGGYMQRNEVGLASGVPRQLPGNALGFLLTPLIPFLLLGFLPLWVARRNASPKFGAGCGQLFVARAADYHKMGGHAQVRESFHDGLTLPRAFRRAGIATGLFDASRLARCRMYPSIRETWRGLSKNATEGMATPLALPVWTYLLFVGQVMPLLLAVAGHGPLAWAALGAGCAGRLLLALRLGWGLISVVFHPLAVAVLLALQWWALFDWARERGMGWRGRERPATPIANS